MTPFSCTSHWHSKVKVVVDQGAFWRLIYRTCAEVGLGFADRAELADEIPQPGNLQQALTLRARADNRDVAALVTELFCHFKQYLQSGGANEWRRAKVQDQGCCAIVHCNRKTLLNFLGKQVVDGLMRADEDNTVGGVGKESHCSDQSKRETSIVTVGMRQGI